MNNKGFTLIQVIILFVIVSLGAFIVVQKNAIRSTHIFPDKEEQTVRLMDKYVIYHLRNFNTLPVFRMYAMQTTACKAGDACFASYITGDQNVGILRNSKLFSQNFKMDTNGDYAAAYFMASKAIADDRQNLTLNGLCNKHIHTLKIIFYKDFLCKEADYEINNVVYAIMSPGTRNYGRIKFLPGKNQIHICSNKENPRGAGGTFLYRTLPEVRNILNCDTYYRNPYTVASLPNINWKNFQDSSTGVIKEKYSIDLPIDIPPNITNDGNNYLSGVSVCVQTDTPYVVGPPQSIGATNQYCTNNYTSAAYNKYHYVTLSFHRNIYNQAPQEEKVYNVIVNTKINDVSHSKTYQIVRNPKPIGP